MPNEAITALRNKVDKDKDGERKWQLAKIRLSITWHIWALGDSKIIRPFISKDDPGTGPLILEYKGHKLALRYGGFWNDHQNFYLDADFTSGQTFRTPSQALLERINEIDSNSYLANKYEATQ